MPYSLLYIYNDTFENIVNSLFPVHQAWAHWENTLAIDTVEMRYDTRLPPPITMTFLVLLLALLVVSRVLSLVYHAPTSRRSSYLLARPPPTDSFDLKAIEAFEEELLAQEAASLQGDALEDDLEDDLDPSDIIETIELVIPEELHGKRIDAALSALMEDTTRSFCGNLIQNGQVQVNGDTIKQKSYSTSTGEALLVQIPRPPPTKIVPEDTPMDILYQDDSIIVINKQAGMVVHPGAGHSTGTVVHAVAHLLDDGFGNSIRPGICHRLDKGTTGVLCIARTPQVLASLQQQFADRSVQKTYVAICSGNPGSCTINQAIERHPVHRQRMRVVPPHATTGRHAVSHVTTLASTAHASLVTVGIETGRTHQIRVHLAHRGTPVYGDSVYGKAKGERPLLHAYRLGIRHPLTDEPMSFCAPVPDDIRHAMKTIKVDESILEEASG